MPTPPPESDEDLARRVRQGDRDAADALIRRHEGVVWSQLTRERLAAMGAPPGTDPRDVAQECFVAVWKAVKHWSRDRGKFSTFMTVVVRNEISDYLRKCRTNQLPADPQGGDDGDDPRRFDQLPAPEPVARPAIPGLDALDPLSKALVRMKFGLDGREATWGEVKDRLGLTPCQAKAILKDAIMTLRLAATAWGAAKSVSSPDADT